MRSAKAASKQKKWFDPLPTLLDFADFLLFLRHEMQVIVQLCDGGGQARILQKKVYGAPLLLGTAMMQNLIASKRQNTNTGDPFDTGRYGSDR